MRLTFPRLCFIVIAGGAFVLNGWLASTGYKYGQAAKEIRRTWATSLPSSAPATSPVTLPGEFTEKTLSVRDKQLARADYLQAESKQLYLYCGILTILWAIAAIKTWNRRWPGERA